MRITLYRTVKLCILLIGIYGILHSPKDNGEAGDAKRTQASFVSPISNQDEPSTRKAEPAFYKGRIFKVLRSEKGHLNASSKKNWIRIQNFGGSYRLNASILAAGKKIGRRSQVELGRLLKGKVPQAATTKPPVENTSPLKTEQLSKQNDKVKSNILTGEDYLAQQKLYSNLTLHERKTIKELIFDVNKREEIYNLNKFDLPVSLAQGILIVVQVHDRYMYLEYLLKTLKNTKYIENALVIFSHDFYSERINKMIRAIDFCPVMQIFYPFSIQLYPDVFPGLSPTDCQNNITKLEAHSQNCTNLSGRDFKGVFRKAHLVQIKHHWFWKINHIFEFMKTTRHYNGPVLFLEEDYIVAPDLLHTLMKMYRVSLKHCPACGVFVLGGYTKKLLFKRGAHVIEIVRWVSNKHNIGLSFNRSTWDVFRQCSDVFCGYDDYNWDWSLQFVYNTCLPHDLTAMVVKLPRVHHIGKCGIHHKKGKCDVTQLYENFQTKERESAKFLFPKNLNYARWKVKPRKSWPNGGWGDPRDMALCMAFRDKETH